MTRRILEIAGQKCRLVVLPRPWPEEYAKFREFLQSDPRDLYGLDVETTAIDEDLGWCAPEAAMRLIQFGTHREAWVLDPHDPGWRKPIISALRNPRRRFVSHTNYDPLWCHREFGVDLSATERIIDTWVMACLVEPGERIAHDLKSLSTRHIDPLLAQAEAELLAHFKASAPVHHRTPAASKAWGFTNIALDDEIFTRYAGLDAIFVRRLLDIFNALIGPRTRALARREQRVARLGTSMQTRGMKLDLDYTRETFAAVDKEWSAADDRLRETFGFTPRSPRAKDWLIERDVRFFAFTPSGAPSLTKETLPALATIYAESPDVGPVLADLLVLSQHSNLRSNLTIMLNHGDNDGYVHPKIKTLAAVTGRMSIVKPAMQTFKKDVLDSGHSLRGCFIARPGHVFVGADYDSQEIRLAVAFSKDKALARILREGLNQHDETARLIFGRNFTDKDRHQAKTLNFAQQYGAGPKRIAAQLGIPLHEARALWLAWRKAYAGLVEWTEQMSELPFVVNPWGRRIPRDPWRHYANGNYMIQSSGRDVLGDALVALADAGWRDEQWLWVHDEIVLEVPEERAEEAAKVLAESMRTTVRGVELTATSKILGTRWSGAAA